MCRDGNLDPTRGYPIRPDPNGPDFTRPDKEQGQVWVLKKKPEAGPGRVWVLSKNPKPDPKPDPDKIRLYIYIITKLPLTYIQLKTLKFSIPLLISAHASASPSSSLNSHTHASLSPHRLTFLSLSPLTTTATTKPHSLSSLLTTTTSTKPRKLVHQRCRCSIIRWTFHTQHFLHPLIETPTVPQRIRSLQTPKQLVVEEYLSNRCTVSVIRPRKEAEKMGWFVRSWIRLDGKKIAEKML